MNEKARQTAAEALSRLDKDLQTISRYVAGLDFGQQAATKYLALLSDVITPDDIYRKLNAASSDFAAQTEAILSDPKNKAWLRLTEILRQAQSDPVVAANPVALEFLEMVETLASYPYGHWDIEQVWQPVVDAVKKDHARKMAGLKNATARAWVSGEWKSRPDKGQSKAAFARQHALLVKSKFGLAVTSETIARDWLPKGKK